MGDEIPPQTQERPGRQSEMTPEPKGEMADYVGSGKLEGKRALVCGGDSGIGRAVSVGFAKEGADVAFAYLEEDDDAARTRELIEQAGSRAFPIRADLSEEDACVSTVEKAFAELGGLDILVNHHGTQYPQSKFEEITTQQWEDTFRVNVTSFFWLIKAALAHLGDGASIINTGSVNGFRGNKDLIDYAASNGAIHTLTYSLSQALQERGIRVNAVAPGPVWTPLIPATFDEEKVASFGENYPNERPAQPDEIAPSYIFLASEQLSGYYTGEILAAIGGETLPGG